MIYEKIVPRKELALWERLYGRLFGKVRCARPSRDALGGPDWYRFWR